MTQGMTVLTAAAGNGDRQSEAAAAAARAATEAGAAVRAAVEDAAAGTLRSAAAAAEAEVAEAAKTVTTVDIVPHPPHMLLLALRATTRGTRRGQTPTLPEEMWRRLSALAATVIWAGRIIKRRFEPGSPDAAVGDRLGPRKAKATEL